MRKWLPQETAECVRLYREERLSYKKIGKRLGRNHSSVGYVIRREDMREEERLLQEEAREAS